MTVTLGAIPVCADQLDLLAEITDTGTPLGSLRRADFERACREDAAAHGGEIHPSRVSAILHGRFGEINPRALSAQWAGACGRNGFMTKTDRLAPIDPTHSRGNGGKTVRLRVLRATSP